MTLDGDSLAFRCDACGSVVAADELLETGFHCPSFNTGDDGDHVLRPALGGLVGLDRWTTTGNPFIDHRECLTAWHVARQLGLGDDAFVDLVTALDEGISRVEGHGFRETPFGTHRALDAVLGFSAPGGVWVKDETVDVSGSHKARHLMGVMLYLHVLERAGARRTGASRRLAIASCGNAALAAAVVARAADRRLEVYVPPSASPALIARLERLGAQSVVCHRRVGERGDPCYLRFHDAVANGALAFCCQGPDNALTIDGGETIVREMLERLGNGSIDRVFFQVGGGAFASAFVRGFRRAAAHGRISALPRMHAVQTAGGFPLARAWAQVVLSAFETMLFRSHSFEALVPAELRDETLEDVHAAVRTLAGARGEDEESGPRATALDHRVLHACAEALRSELGSAAVGEALDEAARSRSRFMWPWEREPRSLAHGILDDETYDWRTVVEGMLESGGWPVVVSEAQVERAHRLARETTGVDVDHTGSAGLAGLLALVDAGTGRPVSPRLVHPTERVAIVLSGATRR